MICFATQNMKEELALLWKQIFNDSDEYIRLIFEHKFVPEHTLVDIEEGKIVAALHMQRYQFMFWGKMLPCYYLVGLGTLPKWRKQGRMEQLIKRCHEEMHNRNIPLSFLVPAEESLKTYYNRLGYTVISSKGRTPLPPIVPIDGENYSLNKAFEWFDKTFNKQDFSIQKNLTDFYSIYQDACIENFPPKYNLEAMAHIVNPLQLLQHFAQAHKEVSCMIELLHDAKTDKCSFLLHHGEIKVNSSGNHFVPCDKISIETLTSLLLSEEQKTGSYLSPLFPSHNVHINHMLE